MTALPHDLDPGTVWALNNPHTAEGQAHLADLERRERIRRAHEPKRFIIRKAAPGLWAVRDQARAHWAWSAGSMPAALGLLALAARDHGAWDGVVRVVLRRPAAEEDLDEYDDDWNE